MSKKEKKKHSYEGDHPVRSKWDMPHESKKERRKPQNTRTFLDELDQEDLEEKKD